MAASAKPTVDELAAKAMNAAVDGILDTAPILDEIYEEHGIDGLWNAIIAWIDTLRADDPSLAAGTAPADGISTYVRWAGQVIMARIRLDSDDLTRLATGIPAAEGMYYVHALLEMVVLAMVRLQDQRAS